MVQAARKTLRLLFPQWQGGYDESEFPGQIYPFGARLLAWLAPKSDAPLVEVPVPEWTGAVAPKEGGVFYRQEILRQIRAAYHIIEEHLPDRIITFGGDCLVSQAPFSYLNERYEGNLGIIWIDAHPDVTTPKDFDHAHAMVLGNLLGEGEPLLASEVKLHIKSNQVTLVGVDDVLNHERETLNKFNINVIRSNDAVDNPNCVIDWIEKNRFAQVAIHLDLDVLNPKMFHSLLFNNPDIDDYIESEHGKLHIQNVYNILKLISEKTDVVGMSFSEYMPWDALKLKKMFDGLNFMK